jgi:hypothetical protein
MMEKETTKKTTMDMFLKRTTPQKDGQAGASGGLPEEGLVITGG